jgi:hypothetical protein
MDAVEVEDQREDAPEEDTTLANTEVVTKYQEAAKIVNATLAEIIALVRLKCSGEINALTHCVIFALVRSWC